MKCSKCGKPSSIIWNDDGPKPYCDACFKKEYVARYGNYRNKNIMRPSGWGGAKK